MTTFCAIQARQAGEELFGTAPQASAFLLLEYNRPWGSKAFEGSDLPAPVKSKLSNFLADSPGMKILLIKSGRSAVESGLRFYVALPNRPVASLFRFQLSDYEQLLPLDLAALLAGEPQFAPYRSPEQLFLVCTNGKRDACCAKFGLPVYGALKNIDEQAVWQCSHMGGHRFAGLVLSLPQGVFYGRLGVTDIPQFYETIRNEQIDLEHYRGQAIHPEIVQAADFFLRRHTRRQGLCDFEWKETHQLSEQQWTVRFQATDSQEIFELQLTCQPTGIRIHQSCKAEKESPVIQYWLINLSQPG